MLEEAPSPNELKALWERNWVAVQMLKENHPELMSERHKHYADILILLFRRRLKEFEAAKRDEVIEATTPISPPLQSTNGGGRVDKAVLAIPEPKRRRDKEHLRRLAALPCLICGRSPSQAHHIRYAQPRAMGRKVSDEWTVPLCATHHRALHDVGDEKAWWAKRGQDPLKHAEKLWREFHNKNCGKMYLTGENIRHDPAPAAGAPRGNSSSVATDWPPVRPPIGTG
jgi:hypothetical protein